ncbi:hypothetical protein [Caballeronia cordobensis]|uniref:hypothetical protein n=1 Tax=Caballeronia cordobensis TaxID=1353886 RepID=UPI00076485B7|nr:hypothetical protein [Caballeronia cordobensis]
MEASAGAADGRTVVIEPNDTFEECASLVSAALLRKLMSPRRLWRMSRSVKLRVERESGRRRRWANRLEQIGTRQICGTIDVNWSMPPLADEAGAA